MLGRELHLEAAEEVLELFGGADAEDRDDPSAPRFNRTKLEEWAYGRLYSSNDERCHAFTRWLHLYNHRRPHTSLDGLTPMAVLVNNAHGNHI